jgi:hypothetical protein
VPLRVRLREFLPFDFDSDATLHNRQPVIQIKFPRLTSVVGLNSPNEVYSQIFSTE